MRTHIFGWLLFGYILNGSCLRPWCNFIFLCFRRSVWRQKLRDLAPPHVPLRHRFLLNISPTPDANFHLIVVCIYRTPKANAPPISLFFDVASKFIPNKGTSRHVRKPSAGRLQLTHRERRRNYLGALLPYSWRESKAAGQGGGGCSCWLLCVVGVVVVVFCVGAT